MEVTLIFLNMRTHFHLSQPLYVGGQCIDTILFVIHSDSIDHKSQNFEAVFPFTISVNWDTKRQLEHITKIATFIYIT